MPLIGLIVFSSLHIPKDISILDKPVTMSVGTILGIAIPVGILFIVIIILLIMCCACPHLLCCYGMSQQKREKRQDKIDQDTAYTQTKGGFQPFVPSIRKTSPSQQDEYAAPIKPPSRRTCIMNH